MRIVNLKGDRVLLRAVELEDLDFLQDMINDSDIEKDVVGWSFPVSKEKQRKWYEKQLDSKEAIRFVITDTNELIGMAILDKIDWKNRSIGINIKLKREKQKQGYGKESISILLSYCFEELNFHRIEANILEDNIASRKLFESCGLTLEGKKRKAIYKKNQYHDLCLYAILKEDYIKG